MQFSDAHDKIAAALVAIQKQAGYAVARDSKNPHFKNTYASLHAVYAAISAAAADNEVAILQDISGDVEGVTCTTTFLHASGQFVRFDPCFAPVGKKDAQAFGGGYTYVRRYSLMAAAGFAPADDDGNAAAETTPERAPSARVSKMLVDGFWRDVAAMTDNTAGVRAMLAAIYSVTEADLEAPTVKVAESLSAALTFMRKLDAAALADKLNKYASA